MPAYPVPSKQWSCATLDAGIMQVLSDATDHGDNEELMLLKEIQDFGL